MMLLKQFSYPDLSNIKSLFLLFLQNLFFRKKISKNTLALIFLRCYSS